MSGLPAAQNVFFLRTIERAFSQSRGIKAQETGLRDHSAAPRSPVIERRPPSVLQALHAGSALHCPFPLGSNPSRSCFFGYTPQAPGAEGK